MHIQCTRARATYMTGERGPGRTLEADARAFVRDAAAVRRYHGLPERGYDALVIDLYTGENPLEMLTTESLGALKRAWLRSGGTLVVNVVAFYAGPHVALARDVVRTLRSVFGTVRCFVDRPPHVNPDVPTNLVTYASDAPLHFAPPRDVPEAELVTGSTDELFSRFEAWQPLELGAATEARQGRVLTDALLQGDGGVEGGAMGVETAEAAAPAGLYGAGGAALEASMAALQHQAMPEEAWELVSRALLTHRLTTAGATAGN